MSASGDSASWQSVFDPALLPLLTAEERAEFDALTRPPLWTPHAGPQAEAYACQADELFYGGSAGGGKSDLILGLAGTRHYRSVIFRREFPQTRALIERSREIYNREGAAHSKDSYNEQLHLWRLGDGRLIEFGSMQFEKDKENHRGRDRDFYGWDEVTQFTESMFRFVNAWNRTTRPGQRCRIVATGNPPTSSDGEWVIRYWAPWLDAHHPNPARPGELRWFVRDPRADRDVEVADGSPVVLHGETVQPRSRTFIPARLKDNPALAGTGYGAMLQGLPEPLRSQMLYGDFTVGVADHSWQAIPTEWVRAAQARWQPSPPGPLNALGVDVAHGGADRTVIVPRHGPWFGMPQKYRGPETDSGAKAAGLVLRHLSDLAAAVNVDAIGYGASCVERLQDYRQPQTGAALLVNPVNNAEASQETDRSGKFRLVNVRAASYWRLREALDPEHGDGLALPPDPEVLADLCAPRYKLTAAGILIEPKPDLSERLGRSPDVGDAVVLAHWLGSATGPWTMGVDRGSVESAPQGVWAGEAEWERTLRGRADEPQRPW